MKSSGVPKGYPCGLTKVVNALSVTLCQQEIDLTDENMDDHHIVYRQFGGSDALSNRVLLHPVCHRRVHALGLKVIKPVPGTGDFNLAR